MSDDGVSPDRMPESLISGRLDDYPLDVYEHRVATHMLRVCGEDGVCWQSQATIAAHIGVSERRVVSARRILVALNIFHQEARGRVHYYRRVHSSRWVDAERYPAIRAYVYKAARTTAKPRKLAPKGAAPSLVEAADVHSDAASPLSSPHAPGVAAVREERHSSPIGAPRAPIGEAIGARGAPMDEEAPMARPKRATYAPGAPMEKEPVTAEPPIGAPRAPVKEETSGARSKEVTYAPGAPMDSEPSVHQVHSIGARDALKGVPIKGLQPERERAPRTEATRPSGSPLSREGGADQSAPAFASAADTLQDLLGGQEAGRAAGRAADTRRLAARVFGAIVGDTQVVKRLERRSPDGADALAALLAEWGKDGIELAWDEAKRVSRASQATGRQRPAQFVFGDILLADERTPAITAFLARRTADVSAVVAAHFEPGQRVRVRSLGGLVTEVLAADGWFVTVEDADRRSVSARVADCELVEEVGA